MRKTGYAFAMERFGAALVATWLAAGCGATTSPPAQEARVFDVDEGTTQVGRAAMFVSLARTIDEQVLPGVDGIDEDRRGRLEELATFVRGRLDAGRPAELTFICTHNSRRSHLAQLWAATAAAYYGLDGVRTYSGGTEATAFNPRAVAAVERAGFAVESSGGDNPRYQVRIGPEAEPMQCFSKVYDDAFNPQEGFAAVMTCTAADAACPFVPGADLRVGLPYVDPKESDDTPAEAQTYDERSVQIAREMFFLMSRVRS